jgi:hypothetical protein
LSASPAIIGERRQTELGKTFFQATHQKRTLVHPLLDCPEWMLDPLTPPVEHTWALRRGACIRSKTASF